MKTIRVFAASLLVVASLSFVSCGGGTQPAETTTEPVIENVTVEPAVEAMDSCAGKPDSCQGADTCTKAAEGAECAQ